MGWSLAFMVATESESGKQIDSVLFLITFIVWMAFNHAKSAAGKEEA